MENVNFLDGNFIWMCYNSRTWKRAVSGMRILVVEDERLLCDGIAEDLRLEKYTVDCCYDGPAACAIK